MNYIEISDMDIEHLALKHEAFGHGWADKSAVSFHGFEPDGLIEFARELIELARKEVA